MRKQRYFPMIMKLVKSLERRGIPVTPEYLITEAQKTYSTYRDLDELVVSIRQTEWRRYPQGTP